MKSFPKTFAVSVALIYLILALGSAALSPRIHIVYLIHLVLFVPLYAGIIFLGAYALGWSLNVVFTALQAGTWPWANGARLILALTILTACGFGAVSFLKHSRARYRLRLEAKEAFEKEWAAFKLHREKEKLESVPSSAKSGPVKSTKPASARGRGSPFLTEKPL